jgi:hypothetical protein
MKKAPASDCWGFVFGAGDESRTRDLNLGKVALYQLSYSRMNNMCVCCCKPEIIKQFERLKRGIPFLVQLQSFFNHMSAHGGLGAFVFG